MSEFDNMSANALVSNRRELLRNAGLGTAFAATAGLSMLNPELLSKILLNVSEDYNKSYIRFSMFCTKTGSCFSTFIFSICYPSNIIPDS